MMVAEGSADDEEEEPLVLRGSTVEEELRAVEEPPVLRGPKVEE